MGSALLQAFAARLAEWKRIRAIANEAFVHTGDQRHIVRRGDVVKHVAERMGVTVSPGFRAHVRDVMVGGGWRAGKNGGRGVFVGVRLRSLTHEQALVASNQLRKEVKA